MSTPEVSTIILTWNRPEMLRLSLRSLLEQRDVDQEILLVDNGSDPPVSALVGEVADPRVILIRNDVNQKPAQVRNDILERARGTWIAYTDDDDLWAPDKLRAQVDACEAEGTAWGYVGVVEVDGHSDIIRGEVPMAPQDVAAALPYRCEVPGGQSGIIVRRDALMEIDGLDATYMYVEDWDLYLRLLKRFGSPTCVAQPLLAYRLHDGQLSNQPDAWLGELTRLNEVHADLRDGGGARGTKGGLDTAFVHRSRAEGALRAGQRGLAAREFLKSARGGHRWAWVLLVTVLLPDRVQRWLRLRRADRHWLEAAEDWLLPLTGRPSRLGSGQTGRD